MKKIVALLIGLFLGFQGISQVSNPKFKRKIDWLLKESVPFISVEDLKKNKDQYVLLDARELNEFKVSHIENAKHIGYDKPDYTVLEGLAKDCPIVVYCSIGYRSEKIGEELQKRGYQKVLNLYGSIFEWTNKSYPIKDDNNQPTNKIHTYSKKWSKWVENESVQKIY